MEIMRHKKICVIFMIIISIAQSVKCDGIVEVFQWKQMDFYNRGNGGNSIGGSGVRPSKPNPNKGSFVFPDQLENIRESRGKRSPEKRILTSRDEPTTTSTRWSGSNGASINASYIPYNNVPMGATHYNGRLFVTIPRRRIGVPSTLNYVDMRKDGNNPSPKLYAYPNFDTNQLNQNFQPNPNRLISVYRTTVDDCKRLWFIDTGMLEYPDNRTQVQRPSVWVIDLRNDRVIRRFEIPQSAADTGRGLASITVDITGMNCNAAFAYIPDLVNNQLSVYSFAGNQIWTFNHNYFNFDPLGGDLNVGGQNFRWDDGIFSVTVGSPNANGFKNVYFHAMASTNEFMVSNEVLQNETNALRSDHGNDFQILGNRGANHQSTMHEYDPRTGVIFYDEIQLNGVGCWNTNKPFSADNHGTVAQDSQRMIYPSDLTIDEQGTIWVMSNSMPIFIYSELDPNVVNFRVWKQNTVNAAKNTVCE